MGLNAYFAYTVVLKMGYSWQMALAAVFVEGIIFILLSLTPVREAVFNAIPMSLKHAVSAGIGLFIAFIGLQNCGLVVDSSTLVAMYNFSANAGEFSTVGITVALAIVGILLTAVLMVRKVKGHILWGMLATWALGILCQLVGLYDPSVKGSLIPDFSGGFGVPSLMPTLGQMDFSQLLTPDFALVVFAFLFVDLFDTLGGIMGMAAQSDLLDEKGRLPRLKCALLSGAVLGTSTVTTFAESAAGMAEGGRTGLTGLFSAALFGLSLFLSPIFLAIPSFATAPALVVVGFLMMGSILKVDFSDYAQAIPAFLCVTAMPFLYSISRGHRSGRHLLCGHPPGRRRREAPFPQSRPVCAGRALYPQILFLLKKCKKTGGPSNRTSGLFLRVRVAVDLPSLQGDVPGGEELLHRNKEISLGVEPVHNGQGGLHTGGKNVVEKDDGAILGVGHHVLDLPGSVLVSPVLRVDGPEDDGTAGIFADGIVHRAVGRAEEKAVVAQDVHELLPGDGYLGIEVGLGETGERDMVVGVNPDLVALGVHAPDEVLVVLQLLADEEKGGLHPPLCQTVQQGGGGGAAGTVVKGEGDELGGLRRRPGRRRHRRGRHPWGRRPGDEQQQDQGRRRAVLPPSRQHDRPPSAVRSQTVCPAGGLVFLVIFSYQFRGSGSASTDRI